MHIYDIDPINTPIRCIPADPIITPGGMILHPDTGHIIDPGGNSIANIDHKLVAQQRIEKFRLLSQLAVLHARERAGDTAQELVESLDEHRIETLSRRALDKRAVDAASAAIIANQARIAMSDNASSTNAAKFVWGAIGALPDKADNNTNNTPTSGANTLILSNDVACRILQLMAARGQPGDNA